MLIKKADISSAFRWSPIDTHPTMIAAGSIAGAMSDDFSSSATLNLYNFDLYDDDPSLSLQGSLEVHDKLNALDWTTHDSYRLGLLGAALVDGAVKIWDPAAVTKDDTTNACVCSIEAHETSATALQFNPVHKHLLATTGLDRDIRIWSLQNPSQPTLSVTPTSAKNPISGDIKAMQWHGKLSHILACCTTGGNTHIWDLKAKRCTSTFSNSKEKGPLTSLAWHPDQPTQIAVAVDASRPLIEVWDLRRAVAPMRSFSAHTDTILSLSWCTSDSNLLLSCGGDGKTVCWNPNTGDIVTELEPRSNWVVDVQWSPLNPTLFAASGFDNALSVFSLNGCPESNKSDGISSSTTAPKWLQRPCGLAHGPNGTLYTFRNESAADGGQKTVLSVTHSNDSVEYNDRCALFQQLRSIQSLPDAHRRVDAINEAFAGDNEICNITEDKTFAALLRIASMTQDGNLMPTLEKLLHDSLDDTLAEDCDSPSIQDVNQLSSSNGAGRKINNLVLTGKIDDAIAFCIQENRFADAFMMLPFASAAMQETLYSDYTQRVSHSFFVRALNAVRSGNIMEAIDKEELSATPWQQLLLFALNYCEESELPSVYSSIGKKVEQKVFIDDELHTDPTSFTLGALLSRMLARDLDAFVALLTVETCWRQSHKTAKLSQLWSNVRSGSWLTDDQSFTDPISLLLEILFKSFGVGIMLDIHVMPELYFLIVLKLCNLLCAQGSSKAAYMIFEAVIVTTSLPEASSSAQRECIIMFDRLRPSISPSASTIWSGDCKLSFPVESDEQKSSVPEQMPTQAQSMNTTIPHTQGYGQMKEEVRNFPPSSSFTGGITNATCTAPAGSTMQYSMNTQMPLPPMSPAMSTPIGRPEGTSFAPKPMTDVHPEMQRSSYVGASIPDGHPRYVPQVTNVENVFQPETQPQRQQSYPNEFTQPAAVNPPPSAFDFQNYTHNQPQAEPSRLPQSPAYAVDRQSYLASTQAAAAVPPSFAIPEEPVKVATIPSYPEGDRISKGIQSMNFQEMQRPSVQTRPMKETLPPGAPVMSANHRPSHESSFDCISMSLERIVNGSAENEIVTNFRTMLASITDKRKRECINKSLVALFELLNEHSLSPEMVSMLHRFTLTAHTPEGKELVRVMGTEHWNAFRKFMNIKFL